MMNDRYEYYFVSISDGHQILLKEAEKLDMVYVKRNYIPQKRIMRNFTKDDYIWRKASKYQLTNMSIEGKIEARIIDILDKLDESNTSLNYFEDQDQARLQNALQEMIDIYGFDNYQKFINGRFGK